MTCMNLSKYYVLVRGLAEECEKLGKGLVIACDANAF